jgi:hypothetical protein
MAPTRPPMPWSISSKISVGVASAWASVLLSASISRAVSPPEATRAIGLSGSPGLALIKNSTWSTPVLSKATRRPSGRYAPSPRSLLRRSPRRSARAVIFRSAIPAPPGAPGFAGRLTLLAQLGAQLADDLAQSCSSCCSRSAVALPSCQISSNSRLRLRAKGVDLLDGVAVLAFEAGDQFQPLLDLGQPHAG